MVKMLATANDLVTRLNDQVFDLTSITNNSSLISSNTPVDIAKYHQLMATIKDTVDKVEIYVKNPQRLLED